MYKKFLQCFDYFLTYSFIGWLYEVLLGIFIFHVGFINRGFLFGPYCPVYGFGALFILILSRYKHHKKIIANINVMPIIIFILIIFITTSLELITSYILEFFLGKWLWDYNNYFMNYQGRIALETSIRFGLGGIIILYIIQPFLYANILKMNTKVYFLLSNFLFILFIIDLIARIFLGSNFS